MTIAYERYLDLEAKRFHVAAAHEGEESSQEEYLTRQMKWLWLEMSQDEREIIRDTIPMREPVELPVPMKEAS